ncbi:hypothetical protein BC351_10710 [Paenibacillus ferrarius]|uniref:Antirepressor protein C-terminal domain-containing protein n=2 Tax=Paenibacillus ferrarius TaxID=1469647 RepID=A0A1V4H9P0_9BACL|nr:hypothetical protein BC351_10710 [Paenibacillus ferrarius]
MKEQIEKIAALEPKATKYDMYLNADGLIQLNEVAKLLNIGLKTFYAILRIESKRSQTYIFQLVSLRLKVIS